MRRFTNIATPPTGLRGFSASAVCSTGHALGMFCPGRIQVSVNTQISASISLTRASSSSYLLRAQLMFHFKIFINIVEHPWRHRDIAELSSVPDSRRFVRIANGASFPGDQCSGNASIYKILVLRISSTILEAEGVPAPFSVIPKMDQYLSCRQYFSHVFQR